VCGCVYVTNWQYKKTRLTRKEWNFSSFLPFLHLLQIDVHEVPRVIVRVSCFVLSYCFLQQVSYCHAMRHVSSVIMVRGSVSAVSVCWGGVSSYVILGNACTVRTLGRAVCSITMYCIMCHDGNKQVAYVWNNSTRKKCK